MIQVCLICVFVHGLILIKMSKRAKAKSPFVLLCISRSFAHIMSSVAMTLSMAVPLYLCVFFSIPSLIRILFRERDALIYGLNVVTPPEVTLYPLELVLAANRFVAVFFWSKYHKIFTFPVTIVRTSIMAIKQFYLDFNCHLLDIGYFCYGRNSCKRLCLNFRSFGAEQ